MPAIHNSATSARRATASPENDRGLTKSSVDPSPTSLVFDSFMTDSLIGMACERLGVDEMNLARRLGVSIRGLRSWKRNPPRYATLALCALIAGLDPELVIRLDKLWRADRILRAADRRSPDQLAG
jgi:hypothetical protein